MTITERDEQGRIVKKTLTSEEARELGKRRHSKPIIEGVNDLLEYMELEGPLYENLCEILVKGGSPGVQAAKELMKERDRRNQPTKQIEVHPGRYYLCALDGSLHEVGLSDKLQHLFTQVLDGSARSSRKFRGRTPR